MTRFLVVDGGIRQFLDLGTGLPVSETIQWRPDSEEEARAPTMAWAGVGRKP